MPSFAEGGGGGGGGTPRGLRRGLVVVLLSAALAVLSGAAQLRYSVPEELEHGAFVANLAEDLGLDVGALSARRFRIASRAGAKQHLEVNLENGILFVNERIDREEVCEGAVAAVGGESLSPPPCLLQLQLVLESPLELHRVEVEVLDVNDHAPRFPWPEYSLEVAESAAPGSRFPLESARDPDAGSNALRTYRLSPNAFFALEVHGPSSSDGSKFAELVLERSLDREQQASHRLLLTALDGGLPERSGSARLQVSVLDANDNVPVFERSSYSVRLREDAPPGTLVVRLNASDADEGPNGEVEYSFSGHAPSEARLLFSVEPRRGEVRLRAALDFERAAAHELYVQAKDRGPSAVAVHCRVLVRLLDVNDNAPELSLTPVSAPVPEDAPTGTVIALVSVADRDSGENGRVTCSLLPPEGPFRLQPAFPGSYTLLTAGPLDREAVAEYNLTLSAQDGGSPALSSSATLAVSVSDVNDNAPRFLQPSYSVSVAENNAPGASLCSVSARDPDGQQNAYLSYSLAEEGRWSLIQGMPVGTYVSINADSGHMYALRSLDYEQIRSFQVVVRAHDAGFPPLSGNATVTVFVLDQNDNAPVIVGPVSGPPSAALPAPSGNGSASTPEGSLAAVPRGAEAGYLVGKVSAVDADAGQNARLSYRLLQATEAGLFSVALHTGEIRTARPVLDRDPPRHRLLVQVRDHGQPPLSASVALLLSLVDGLPETLQVLPASDGDPSPSSSSSSSPLTLSLIVSLGSISFTFLIAILVLTAVKCRKDRRGFFLPPWRRGCDGDDGGCGGGGDGAEGGCCSCDPSAPPGSEVFKNNAAVGHPLPPAQQQQQQQQQQGSHVGEGPPGGYCYKVCLSPDSAKSDFMFLKPYGSSPPGKKEERKRRKSHNLAGPDRPKKDPAAPNNSHLGQVKQPNADWLPSKQSALKSSQSLEDVGGIRRGVQKDHDRLRTLVTPVSELQKGSGPANSVWTPRYGPLYSQHISPLDYQHNVYIPGTPTMPASKDGPLFLEQETKNSFSTFGKRKKMTTYCDIHDNMIINNNLK